MLFIFLSSALFSARNIRMTSKLYKALLIFSLQCTVFAFLASSGYSVSLKTFAAYILPDLGSDYIRGMLNKNTIQAEALWFSEGFYRPRGLMMYPNTMAGVNSASMYPSPIPTPPIVGHTYYTYQPLMPHEMMYAHKRNYYTPMPAPGGYYQDPSGCQGSGYGYNKTTVVWQHHGLSIGPNPLGGCFQKLRGHLSGIGSHCNRCGGHGCNSCNSCR